MKPLIFSLVCALSACEGGTDEVSTTTSQLIEVRNIVLAQRSTPDLPDVDRALLDTLTIASLEISVENRATLAYWIPAGTRDDPFHGPMTIWRTGDNAQVAIRNGVVVATKGFGDDLQGSNMRGTVQTVSGKDADKWDGSLTVVTSAEGPRDIALDCLSQKPERKTLEIFEVRYAVNHLRETCFTDSGLDFVVNEYWVDVSDGTVWQTRQWLGPGIGYVKTRFLKKI